MSSEMPLNGVLVVDKPSGPTSSEVVQQVKRILRSKAGHTGTLDPTASGVLPVVLGQATRLSRFFLSSDKLYLAAVRLGIVTDTYDSEGTILQEGPVPPIESSRLEALLQEFEGTIEQVVPAFSAVKVKGERLYSRARKGLDLERPTRSVTVYGIELIEQGESLLHLRIHCSGGTYIRSLAHDIGRSLGCGAYLESLRRERSGEFSLERAVPLQDVQHRWRESFYPMEEVLTSVAVVELEEPAAQRILHGNSVPCGSLSEGETYRVFRQGRLLAFARCEYSHLQPFIVFQESS